MFCSKSLLGLFFNEGWLSIVVWYWVLFCFGFVDDVEIVLFWVEWERDDVENLVGWFWVLECWGVVLRREKRWVGWGCVLFWFIWGLRDGSFWILIVLSGCFSMRRFDFCWIFCVLIFGFWMCFCFLSFCSKLCLVFYYF